MTNLPDTCDFLVIGGGPGGTPAAMALAAAGRRVLLVEQGAGPGGTCLFEGCIPSKIYHEAARRLREFRQAPSFGLRASGSLAVDWPALQARKAALLERRSRAARQRLAQLPGLTYVRGRARLLDARTAEVTPHDGGAHPLRFEQAILATGSRPALPPIPGIDLPGVMDSDALLASDTLPERLVIIGGGPIGVELGQIFHAFGVAVEIIEAAPRILGAADAELAGLLQQRLEEEGIAVHVAQRVETIQAADDGGLQVACRDAQGQTTRHAADRVLVVTGRRPNVDGLGLEAAGVRLGRHGIEVDARLATGVPGIHAVGDVVGPPMFAHWATAQALALARHLLGQPAQFPPPAHNTDVIFSHPELGMAGLTEAQAAAQGIETVVARYDFRTDARAQISGEEQGLLKIVAAADDLRVLGVHVLAAGATVLLGEAAVLVSQGVTLPQLAAAIHPHPTWSESFAQAARAFLAQRQRR